MAGGRSKRRRLAQALLAGPGSSPTAGRPRPGRSQTCWSRCGRPGRGRSRCRPAPSAASTCARYQRRGEDWYCSVCGPVREPCAACGQIQRVHRRDRDGRPRCAKCPPGDGRTPLAIVDDRRRSTRRCPPRQSPAAAASAVPQAGQRQQLAWALQDCPGLLTGEGAEAPVPSVLRLIDRLRRCRRAGVVRPRLPALRPRHAAVSPRRRGMALPQLHRQVQGPAVLPLRDRPRGRRPRRGRPAAVSALPDHRPGQPGDLRRLRPPAAGQRPHARTARSAPAAAPGRPRPAASAAGRPRA